MVGAEVVERVQWLSQLASLANNCWIPIPAQSPEHWQVWVKLSLHPFSKIVGPWTVSGIDIVGNNHSCRI